MKQVKIIGNYLPQYHRIPENDKWWGEGYTDWVAVKKSKPLYEGHRQPRVPMDEYYYDLSDVNSLKWQAELARQYGIYGFGIYHYWFSDDLHLLGKPAELLLEHPEIDINYMFIWDNGSWKRTWSNIKGYTNVWAPSFDTKQQCVDNGMLAELVYGDERNWKAHFDYLLPFFKDSRYIKIDGKPVFAFFSQYNNHELILKMTKYWNKLAIDNGLPGVTSMGKHVRNMRSGLDYEYYYEPQKHAWEPHVNNLWEKGIYKISNFLKKFRPGIEFFQYDRVWQRILSDAKKNQNPRCYYGAFARYDDTPRRGENGKVIKDDSPAKFENYMKQLVKISEAQDKEYIFVTAWNEWGEGAYLEPDTGTKLGYLEAIQRSNT